VRLEEQRLERHSFRWKSREQGNERVHSRQAERAAALGAPKRSVHLVVEMRGDQKSVTTQASRLARDVSGQEIGRERRVDNDVRR
jgi:hypothetical protein